MLNYLKLFRFPLVFTAIADSATGYLLVWALLQGAEPANPLIIMILGLASGALYCFGMAMNDVADRDRDKTLAPTRMLPSGKISLRGAQIACFLLLVVSGVGAGGCSLPWTPMPLVIWAAMVLTIMGYNFVYKAAPAMAIIRALNVLLGASAGWAAGWPEGGVAGGVDQMQVVLILAVPALVYVTALTFVSTLEEGKIRLSVIAIGASFMVLGAFMPGLIRLLVGMEVAPQGWIVSAALSCLVIWRSAQARDRRGVMMIVRDGVAGIIILDAAILCSEGLIEQGLVIAVLIIPALLFIAAFKKFA